jgi:hypothetical protein
MSPVAQDHEEDLDLGPRESVEFYLPVVREYADKLDSLFLRADSLLRSQLSTPVNTFQELALAEAAWLIDQYECLRPHVEQLVRRTATLLDHARISRNLELHLTLRQEELESSLRLAPAVFAKLEAAFGSKKVRQIIENSRVKPLRP